MNETQARQVLVLRAFETAMPASPLWTDEDAKWASRVALEAAPAAPTLAGAEAFFAARAHAAWQRLGPRLPRTARAAAWALRPWAWLVLVLALGVGLWADALGVTQHINLLAPPLWSVVLWNLVVCAVWLWRAVTRAPGKPPVWLNRWLGEGAPPWPGVGGAFAADWAQHSAPLAAARVATWLHAGAAALGLGLLVGLYVRGMVLDYRVAWQSTFLDAAQVHAALAWLLAPAAWASGVALPDVQAVAGLRVAPGASVAQASAAPWIHLYATTALLFVVLPRSLLGMASAWRAHALSRDFALALEAPYFVQLHRRAHQGATRVQVWPHGQALATASALALQRALQAHFGADTQLHVAPTCAHGEEAQADLAALASAPDVLLIAFDMTATPEAEQQGRWVQRLRAAGQTSAVLLLDATAFNQRFADLGERLAQRQQVWQAFAVAHGVALAVVDWRAHASALVVAQALRDTLRQP